MEKSLFVVLLAFACVAWAQEESGAAEAENDPVNAVVKLEVTTAKPDIRRPWIIENDGGTGSGVVIGDGRILTCAHCVVDTSYIRVRKQNEDTLYHAEVLFTDNVAAAVEVLVGVNAELYDERLRNMSNAQRAVVEALAREPAASFDERYRLRHSLPVSSTLHTALKELADDGVVESDGEGHRLADPMFGRYINRSPVCSFA